MDRSMDGFGPALLVCRSGPGIIAQYTDGRRGLGMNISDNHPARQSKVNLGSDSAFLNILCSNSTNLALQHDALRVSGRD